MRISDWSSDVCSSDLLEPAARPPLAHGFVHPLREAVALSANATADRRRPASNERSDFDLDLILDLDASGNGCLDPQILLDVPRVDRENKSIAHRGIVAGAISRSEEHTSELQSLMRISYA